MYSSPVKASSVYKMSETYLRGTDQRSCVVNILLDLLPSSFIFVSKNVIFHLERQKFQKTQTGEKKLCDIMATYKKMIYIDIGHKSAVD